jgi:hypothetical protein
MSDRLSMRHELNLRLLAAVVFMGAVASTGCESPTKQPKSSSYEHLYVVEEFSLDQPGEAWTCRTPDLWHIRAEGDRRYLQMKPPPDRPMAPGVRRPQEYAVYNKHRFRSFNLSCRVRIDNDPSVQGRDACIIFSRRDKTHMYYVHLSNHSSGFHNTIVRVDGQTRRSLLPAAPVPAPAITDRQWHKVDVIRDADSGLIQIYVDAFEPGAKPLFEVRDRTYEWGHIALGSFNDHASFDHVLIEGQARP